MLLEAICTSSRAGMKPISANLFLTTDDTDNTDKKTICIFNTECVYSNHAFIKIDSAESSVHVKSVLSVIHRFARTNDIQDKTDHTDRKKNVIKENIYHRVLKMKRWYAGKMQ